ncbi:hypothetical protein GN956_G22688 [Arapaima gigas]
MCKWGSKLSKLSGGHEEGGEEHLLKHRHVPASACRTFPPPLNPSTSSFWNPSRRFIHEEFRSFFKKLPNLS